MLHPGKAFKVNMFARLSGCWLKMRYYHGKHCNIALDDLFSLNQLFSQWIVMLQNVPILYNIVSHTRRNNLKTWSYTITQIL